MKYFVFFSLKHISCKISSKWQSLVSVCSKLAQNVVRYDDLTSSIRWWKTELVSIRERYFTLFNSGKMPLRVGPLGTGLISAWFSLARSRHSLIFPLEWALVQSCCIILLFHPHLVVLWCFAVGVSNSLKGFCST